MKLEERLRRLMELRSGNIRAFAIDADIKYTTLRSILERGVMKANVENIFKIAEHLGMTAEEIAELETGDNIVGNIMEAVVQLEPPRQVYVYSVAEEQLEEQNNILQFPTEQTRSIITNRRSAAGNMIEVDDELASKEVIPASMVPKGADELVEITGASMEPLIMQGSEVYIRHQPSVENGEVAIVRIENEGVTCKRVYFENNMIRLKSENDDYEDMFFDPSQVTVLGKVLL